MTDRAPTTPSRRSFFGGVGIAGAAAVTGAAVPTSLTHSASAAPVPGYNEEITCDRVIERAMFWVEDPRDCSMENFDIGPGEDSGILWRMDCSGFVSMALAVRFDDNPTGLTTETLHPDGGYEISHSISKDDLLPGDFILQKNADSESGVGHVVLFNGWVDGGYNVLEQSYGAGGTTSRTTTRSATTSSSTDRRVRGRPAGARRELRGGRPRDAPPAQNSHPSSAGPAPTGPVLAEPRHRRDLYVARGPYTGSLHV